MASLDFKNRWTYLIAGLVIFFSLFTLWIRLIPLFSLGNADILNLVASDDPLYNLRQVELLLANFPTYAWYDAMSLYPTGTVVYWGPLFIYISTVACMITGAVTRPEIIGTCLLIPPVMATIVTALMYFVGKSCGNWKTGLLASGFTAIVSGQYFYRSLYGYFDHHIGEVLFSTLFCLIYIYALKSNKDSNINLQDVTTWKKTAFLSALAGFAYLLGLFLMPTMILFAMIVGIFTVIQFIIDTNRNRSSEYLLIINVIIFTMAIIGLLIFGFKSQGIDLSTYSIGHVYAYLGMIGGTAFLYVLARYLKGKEKYYYPAAIAGCALLFAAVLFVVVPQIFNLLIVDLFAFFGQAPITNTVEEARGWAPDLAWMTFNYGLLLMAGGAIVMVYNNLRDEHPPQIFALIWSLVILFSTWQHIRYEYYLAINVALLSAVCVSFAFDRGGKDLCRIATNLSPDREASDNETPRDPKVSKGKNQKNRPKQKDVQGPDYITVGLLIIVAALGILFVITSFGFSYSTVSESPIHMNQDWKESLEWMANNTPDTGVNYFAVYDPKTFRYPSTSYGVMSWWDYGHMITYIAKRIPNANPFQQGVTGPAGSATFFMSTSEDTANHVLDNAGTRYIITDIEMDTGKFWAMATWYNSTVSTAPYQMELLAPSSTNQNQFEPHLLNNDQYYLTMISRLHNFDGSLTTPTTAYYIEYQDPEISHISAPVMTGAEAMNVTAAKTRADQYNLKAPTGYHATVLSPGITLPTTDVPALTHYRLVHESPDNIFSTPTPDVKYVKVFEYVKGAHIKGNGIIEVPIVTNTGRQFTYRQQSVNGEFVVPYSTTGNPYGVKASGKYQIEGTGNSYDVPESAVIQGTVIQ